MPDFNCFYRVLVLEMERQKIKTSRYEYYMDREQAEERIKFFLKKNEEIFSRLGHVPDKYITAFNQWDIVDHIPEGLKAD